MEFVFFYLGLSAVVGVVAQCRRNRNGVGWFLLSLLISPLLAGLLVAATANLQRTLPRRQWSHCAARRPASDGVTSPLYGLASASRDRWEKLKAHPKNLTQ